MCQKNGIADIFNYFIALKVQCLFFYLLISFTNGKCKQNLNFNKRVCFFYQQISSTVNTQHSDFDAIFSVLIGSLVAVIINSGPLSEQICKKMASKFEHCVLTVDDIR